MTREQRSFTKEDWAAIALALTRLAFCTYRAVTQSIVHDEGFSFQRFVSGPWSTVYSPYDANNHVLNTLLAKLSIRLFGLSELTLRLPSLLGGFFLMLGVYWVLRPLTKPLPRWIALLAIGLHPLLLDMSVAARGYSISLAFLIWGIYFATRERYVWTGVLLGFALSANLTIAFPGLALIVAAVLVTEGPILPRWKIAAKTLLPAIAIFGLICTPALLTARREYFYVGASTFYDSAFSFVLTSIHQDDFHPGLFGNSAPWITVVILPLLAALILFSLRGCNRKQWMIGLTFLTVIFGLVTAHLLLHLIYPADRTGLYLVLLFGMTWAIAAGMEKLRAIRALHLLFAGAVLAQFATQLETTFFVIWKYDMDTKRIAHQIQQASSNQPAGSQKLCVDWIYQPALEFYRIYLHADSWQPVERTAETPLSGCEFYLLHYPDQATIANAGLHEIFDNPVSGAFLAIHDGTKRDGTGKDARQ